jgi:hypothetical protein
LALRTLLFAETTKKKGKPHMGYTPVIPAPGGQRQEDHESQDSLGYIREILSQKKKKR